MPALCSFTIGASLREKMIADSTSSLDRVGGINVGGWLMFFVVVHPTNKI